MAKWTPIAARILIGLLFIMAGIGKLMNAEGTAQYIESVTPLPGILAMPTGAFELVAGLVLAAGRFTRITAYALAGFTALATVLFHNQLGDQTQLTMALKNLAIIGGLSMVAQHSEN